MRRTGRRHLLRMSEIARQFIGSRHVPHGVLVGGTLGGGYGASKEGAARHRRKVSGPSLAD